MVEFIINSEMIFIPSAWHSFSRIFLVNVRACMHLVQEDSMMSVCTYILDVRQVEPASVAIPPADTVQPDICDPFPNHPTYRAGGW